jgi:hypothetical protein
MEWSLAMPAFALLAITVASSESDAQLGMVPENLFAWMFHVKHAQRKEPDDAGI